MSAQHFAEHLGPFLDSPALADALREHGVRCSSRTPLEWARRYSGLSVKIGHARVFPQRIVPLLLSEIHFSEIAARLRDFSQYSAEPDSPRGRLTVRRQAGRRGGRQRGQSPMRHSRYYVGDSDPVVNPNFQHLRAGPARVVRQEIIIAGAPREKRPRPPDERQRPAAAPAAHRPLVKTSTTANQYRRNGHKTEVRRAAEGIFARGGAR